MFGYVNVLQDELKIKEFNCFKAYYCGLCKRQGELLGQATRLALSYDFTALALILDSLTDAPCKMVSSRCMLHPTKRRSVAKGSDALDYCCHMSVALTYYKIKDDIADKPLSGGYAALPFFLLPMKKIRAVYPEKVAEIESRLAKLSALEKENCKNIDLTSAQFGKLMSCLFDYNGENSVVLKEMGYTLGRWLYIVDAIDDFNSDIKKKNFNPFTSVEDIKNSLPSLWYNLSEVAKATELLTIKRNKNLIDNIIYYGIRGATLKALKNAGIEN